MGLEVLIVNDSGLQLRRIASALKAHGLSCTPVLESRGAPRALRRLTQRPADVVICNWQMQGMDGLSFLTAARRIRAARLVLLTPELDQVREAHAQKLGASSVLVEPFDGQRLAATVVEALAA